MAVRRVGPLGVGLILVAVYAVAVVASLPLGHGVRPLFEGIGPPPAYRWVKPPAAFAATNVPPRPNESDVALGPQGSDQATMLDQTSCQIISRPLRFRPSAHAGVPGAMAVT